MSQPTISPDDVFILDALRALENRIDALEARRTAGDSSAYTCARLAAAEAALAAALGCPSAMAQPGAAAA